ncbi:MAG: RNA polymerase sigma factor [Fimbriimonadaceae bacterium]|nr:RNA polymerase sigma factor [Fimbriimonadaceae bacterium]
MYRFALRLSGNRSVAEDLASETILAALQRLHRNADEPLHRAYLFGIVVNKWRRVRRIRTDAIDDLVASNSPNLAALIDLERAFRQLPPKLQEVFVLVKAEGFTSKEAAEVLRLPQGTVQARVHEAVHRMRRLLGVEIPVSTTPREAKT